ncbi:type I restriction-modification system subunit M [Arenibacter sp. TNZ]|uniref:type I restriction-modification system subunit M n=1 Tax=Arenibacter TaxID=178469 RepID=UPI000CD3B9F8|nr:MULTISPECIES: type I restriction-modification system subunit M [Arenibacter]MCM4171846.1 type I restriction-modification system subunit M [Arenibacter sp. TNZ]
MAIKKSELYSSLWASCDELRGGMDASQYKDYVLVMLFLKYISDKWAGQPYAPITIPNGASFKDMVALKGSTDIGDQINKKIVGPIAEANKLADMPDFNDVSKLGSGKEMVDRLTNLIAIFEKPELDFSKNKAEGDDILGDAYEYLMRHFATESGKSKGQFYTPAEVSRIMAKIIGINDSETTSDTTVYDPACGSGSLLLKVSGEAKGKVTLYGQEKDAATSGLARMNMILHDYPTAEIKQGNTLANPLFLNKENNLKTFDFVVANPPFSDKRWSNGLNLPEDNPYNRFQDYGIPPSKNGDYAFLLHIVRSLKRHGKGAVILPHGVLFRGNAEAEIRTNLIKKGYIKGIIGLPANLFYGTGIPACIILIEKENAQNRKGIFMVDAGKGFIKDGNKNRLREQDIHRIADVFNQQEHIPGFSKMISINDIETNEYNLNIPRYIESQETEDLQDIEAHLKGGIPNVDIDALQNFWNVYPNVKGALFQQTDRPKYSNLKVDNAEIKNTIFEHPEFVAFSAQMDNIFTTWKVKTTTSLKALTTGFNPKELMHGISEDLLAQYSDKPLIDKYDMYQHLMTYWFDVMQDDAYIITQDGWKAETYRIIVESGKNKKKVDKGWDCDLVPKELVINSYFKKEKKALEILLQEKETIASSLTELEEEQSGEDGVFTEFEKVNKATISARIKELKADQKSSVSSSAVENKTEIEDELRTLNNYIALLTKQTDTNKKIKEVEVALDDKLYSKYPTLTEAEIKTLVVDNKWMQTIESTIKDEIDHISQRLTNRVKELAERYAKPLPLIDAEVENLESKVNAHLEKMGFVWN